MAAALPPPGDDKTLYVIDLSGYVFRAYHGVPPLSNSKGEPTHATMGVTNMLLALVRAQRPKYLAVAMDGPGDTFRNTLYPAYKANRPPAPPDLAQQMKRCREVAEAFAIPVMQCDGFEADDLIATAITRARAAGLHVVVASDDKDLLQLVADDVLVWQARKQRVCDRDAVVAEWGVGPERVRDLLALMGDSSDNVPGVDHVGQKTAAKLLQEYGSLDGVYQNVAKVKGKTQEYLRTDEANARLSYTLVGLRDDVPMAFDLDDLMYGGWDKDKLRSLFVELEFNKLAESLEGAKAVTAAPQAEPVYEAVLTLESLEAAVAACRAAGAFAVDTETTSLDTSRAELVGVSLAWKPLFGVYIPLGHRYLGVPPQIPRAQALAVLGPLLADPTVKKWGQNIKYDDIILRRAGVPVAGYDFDTMLASYLIDPERHTHKLDEISRTELGYEMVPYEAVTGSGKKQVTFDQVEIARATQYAAEDAEVVCRLVERLRPRVESEGLGGLLREVEIPLALVLGRIEERGILLDGAHLKALSKQVSIDVARLEKECHDLVGKTFNVNAPRQLETILFDDLKLPVFKRTKTARSTDAEVLEELAEKHPLPRKILELRSLTKLQGTYLDTLPTLADPDGRIHTSFNQAVAATGRLSSSNPNLQNIPIRTPLGREIRRAFRAPPGHLLLAADYSQIELRVLAHLSRDPILVDAFQRNEDVHVRTAMEVFKVAREDVTRDMRARAKTVNFAVIYGQGDAALARQLSITREEAAGFITAYFTTFATLKAYLDGTVETARSGEVVQTILGRRRYVKDIHSSNRALRLAAERIATNTPIQGTSADIIKVAMVRVEQGLLAAGLGARMVLTVHDELVLEVPEPEKDAVEALVRKTMEAVMALSVPLRVECGWADNWGDAH